MKEKASKIRFYLFLGGGFAMLYYFLPPENEIWNWKNISKSLFDFFFFFFVIFYLSYWFSSYLDKKFKNENEK